MQPVFYTRPDKVSKLELDAINKYFSHVQTRSSCFNDLVIIRDPNISSTYSSRSLEDYRELEEDLKTLKTSLINSCSAHKFLTRRYLWEETLKDFIDNKPRRRLRDKHCYYTNEYIFIFYKNSVLAKDFFWNYASDELKLSLVNMESAPDQLVTSVASEVSQKANFWTANFIQALDGSWSVSRLADAQFSHFANIPYHVVYESLLNLFK